MLLYRLLQKGYTNVMNSIAEEENAEKQKKLVLQLQQTEQKLLNTNSKAKANSIPNVNAYANVNVNSIVVQVMQNKSRNEMEDKFAMSSPSIANPRVFQGMVQSDQDTLRGRERF
ncbi:hypothetical protein QL285_053295 [Trifolium repens]|nr:hypothetical protein QL285_053295 [Trifolium repens]